MSEIIETWKAVAGFEGLYEVSDLGRVRSLGFVSPIGKYGTIVRPGKVLKPANANGYYRVVLYKKGRSMLTVHRLVATAFLDNHDNKPHVNHRNGVKTDNRLENLEWCDAFENMQHASKMGLLSRVGNRINNSFTAYKQTA